MKFEISQQLFYLSRAKFSFVIQSECAYKGVRNCSDGNGCVLRDFFCDGMKDCTDGSDEDSCEGLFELKLLVGLTGIFCTTHYRDSRYNFLEVFLSVKLCNQKWS